MVPAGSTASSSRRCAPIAAPISAGSARLQVAGPAGCRAAVVGRRHGRGLVHAADQARGPPAARQARATLGGRMPGGTLAAAPQRGHRTRRRSLRGSRPRLRRVSWSAGLPAGLTSTGALRRTGVARIAFTASPSGSPGERGSAPGSRGSRRTRRGAPPPRRRRRRPARQRGESRRHRPGRRRRQRGRFGEQALHGLARCFRASCARDAAARRTPVRAGADGPGPCGSGYGSWRFPSRRSPRLLPGSPR